MGPTTLTALLLITALPLTASQYFELTILHTNRIMSAFEPYNNRYGIARAVKYINETKNMLENVLYFDTMDCFFGSIYFVVHGWRICASFMNLLPVDAYGLGENEMQQGSDTEAPQNLAEYLSSLKEKTVLCTNCDLSRAPLYQKYVTKSKVFDYENGSMRVGVVSYIARDVPPSTVPLNITFTDEVAAVKEEVKKLKQQGVQIVVLLAHCKAEKSRTFVKLLSHIDVIVGGHSYELYYNGRAPIDDVYKVGNYPEQYEDIKGMRVIEVRCGSQLRYVGKIDMLFTETGMLLEYEGNPVHMDESIGEYPEVSAVLQHFKKDVEQLQKQVIGQSRVRLQGECVWNECSMGNLITDSLIKWFMSHRPKGPDFWTDVGIAIFASGTLRADIVPKKENNFSITYGDVLTVLPFENTVVVLSLNGSVLKEAMEYSVANTQDNRGRTFLQVSGLRVVYDFSRPAKQRVKLLKARCIQCPVPKLEEVVDNHIYRVSMNSYLASGGYGFTIFKDLKADYTRTSDVNALKMYIERMKFINPTIEERTVSINCPVCDQNLPPMEN